MDAKAITKALSEMSMAHLELLKGDELRQFESICHHWEALARDERRKRADAALHNSTRQ